MIVTVPTHRRSHSDPGHDISTIQHTYQYADKLLHRNYHKPPPPPKTVEYSRAADVPRESTSTNDPTTTNNKQPHRSKELHTQQHHGLEVYNPPTTFPLGHDLA